MITTQNIYKAIKQRLTEFLPSINCQIKDVKNISAPCLYIEAFTSSINVVADNTIQSNEVFNVVYFSDKETLLDLTNVEKQLLQAFVKPVKLVVGSQTRFLHPTISTEIDETDYVFTLGLTFEFLQSPEVANPYDEYMNDDNMTILNVQKKEG